MAGPESPGGGPAVPGAIPEDPVAGTREALEGEVAANYELLLVRDYNAVVRRDYAELRGKVKLVCGGSSSRGPHYPSFVGRGLLTAAIVGREPAAMPSPREVEELITLLSVGNPGGVLVLGADRVEERVVLGLGLERARRRGAAAEALLLGEDAWECPGPEGRRPLPGILLLIKLAGAMAEEGKAMREVFGTCRAAGLVSISASLAEGGGYVVGTGMDGSGAGLRLPPLASVSDLVKAMSDYVVDPKRYFSMRLEPRTSVVALVNSYHRDDAALGRFAGEVGLRLDERLAPHGVKLKTLATGQLVGGPPGFSLTLYRDYSGGDRCEWLEAAVSAKGWAVSTGPGFARTTEGSGSPGRPRSGGRRKDLGPAFADPSPAERAVEAGARAVLAAAPELDALDPNGRYGRELAVGAGAVLSALASGELETGSPYALLYRLSRLLESSIPGLGGALYGVLFLGAAQGALAFSPAEPVSRVLWARCLEMGVDALSSYTKRSLGPVSLLSALEPVAAAVAEAVRRGKELNWKELAEAVRSRRLSSTKREYRYGASAVGLGVWLGAVLLSLPEPAPARKRPPEEDAASAASAETAPRSDP